MNQKWMPITAGVLDLVGGAFQLFLFLYSLFFGLALGASWIALIVAFFFLVIGILAVIGGIYALRRKRWGLALAASVLAFFPSMLWPLIHYGALSSTATLLSYVLPLILGICAIALTVLSRKQFE
jgi:hypothetical protein